MILKRKIASHRAGIYIFQLNTLGVRDFLYAIFPMPMQKLYYFLKCAIITILFGLLLFFSQMRDAFGKNTPTECFFSENCNTSSPCLFLMLGEKDLEMSVFWIDYWLKKDFFAKIFLIDYDAKTEPVLKQIAKQNSKNVVFLKDFDYAPLRFLPPYQHPALYVYSGCGGEFLAPILFYHDVPLSLE